MSLTQDKKFIYLQLPIIFQSKYSAKFTGYQISPELKQMTHTSIATDHLHNLPPKIYQKKLPKESKKSKNPFLWKRQGTPNFQTRFHLFLSYSFDA